MRLYYAPLSGHAHRAHLFLSLLGLEHELVEVNLKDNEHKTQEFLAINVFGQVPVLDDDGVIVPDSNAILVYLAKKYGRTDWLPETPREAAAVQRWLSVAAGQVAFGPCAARLINLVDAPFNAEEVIARSHVLLKVVDAELAQRPWLAGSTRPTIADVALYSYIARAPEGNVDLSAYGHVDAWLKRIEALPGFVELRQSPIGLSAAA
jgi:glutathione S-transferase